MDIGQEAKIIIYIFQKYRKIMEKDDLADDEIAQQFRISVEEILNQMDRESVRILTHDFILNKDPDWYLDYYAKSTYIRLKSVAIRKFINLLNK